MTKEQLAELMNGREYMEEITPDEEAIAKAHGLLAIFGASDDLLEFRGVYYDEIGAYGGAEVTLAVGWCAVGVLREWNDQGHYTEEEAEDHFRLKRQPHRVKIEAKWGDPDTRSWTITTDVPHAKFMIHEDGSEFCEGIVIDVTEIAPIQIPVPVAPEYTQLPEIKSELTQ